MVIFSADSLVIHTGSEVSVITTRFMTEIPINISVGTKVIAKEEELPTQSNSQASFQLYVNGSYLSDCENRIRNYKASNKNAVISTNDIYCACYGICQPPLAPNPVAYAFYMAWKIETDRIRLTNSLRDNAPFLAVNVVIFLIGITGTSQND